MPRFPNINHTCHKHVPKFTFIYSKTFNLFSFRSFEYERIWWDLFRTRVIRTEFDKQMTMIFCFLRRCFLSAITVLWKAGTAYLSKAPEFTPGFLVSPCCSSLWFFVLCSFVLCVFTLWVPCCDVRYDFRIKTMVGSSLPPVVCGRGSFLNYLRCLCLSACDGVRHVLCCVFLRIVCAVLPFSLDCPFLIAPSVFSNVYLKTLKWLCWVFVWFFFVLCALCCQFLSIVHF